MGRVSAVRADKVYLVGFMMDWYVFVQTEVVAVDMRQLDHLATSRLPRMWDTQEFRPATSSIFHFGLDGLEGRLRGWRYQSPSFHSESLQDLTVGIMPGPRSLIRSWAEGQTLDQRVHAFIGLMRSQQRWDRSDEAPESDRSGIGGEIHLLALSPDHQTLWTCYKLDGFGADLKTSLRKTEVE